MSTSRKRRATVVHQLPSSKSPLSNVEKDFIQQKNCCYEYRDWTDHLVWSNLVYVAASLISVYHSQYVAAVLQLAAGAASTKFHRNTEHWHFLPLDATVSSTLAFLFIFLITRLVLDLQAYDVALAAVIQAGFAVFAWVYCGLPGNPRYERWHAVWHYASALTTAYTSILLSRHHPSFDLVTLEWIAASLISLFMYY